MLRLRLERGCWRTGRGLGFEFGEKVLELRSGRFGLGL